MSNLFGSKPSTPQYYYQPPLPETLVTPPTPPSPNSPEARAAAERIQRQNTARLGRQATVLTSPTGLQPSSSNGNSILGS